MEKAKEALPSLQLFLDLSVIKPVTKPNLPDSFRLKKHVLSRRNLKKYDVDKSLNLKDMNTIARIWIDSIPITEKLQKSFSVSSQQIEIPIDYRPHDKEE
ncbi:hypothetical protein KM1_089480 [Entamoeba histolytica HM-3:IMSS]|uniref:Uncharacterized protein n=2 Tax=Entamoeba histolytica TaxID=5759 RepID=A0A175JN12_ENTHI|nr:hypothetical protein KM1_089480 [Entamoeba histolytica HM-3:IMSS]GAT94885.1 hypothetical protein CL6EHI_c00097 [Entamoeba histolytica]